LPFVRQRSEWRVPNTPRWEGYLVDRTTAVHRNSHSASREQPQSRKTGQRSIRRNISLWFEPSRVFVCTNRLSPRPPMFHSQQDISRLLTLTTLAVPQQHRRMARLGQQHRGARQTVQNMVPPKSARHTAFLKDDKGRRAGAEGIWSPPAQQGNYQWKLPSLCW
jgi:hypothetical protein